MSFILQKYTTPPVAGAFSGLDSFAKDKKLKNKEVLQIKSFDTYNLHKPTRRKFLRRKTFVSGIDQQWQVDLIDMKKYKTVNSYYSYILTCIDVFSKYAWAIPLKNKSSKKCRQAFETIVKQDNRKPQCVYSDLGNEFKGECKKFFKENEIIHLYTKSIYKASIVERFNRTLKEKMFRYFSHTQRFRYIDILNDLVSNYNNSYHRSIKQLPSKVYSKNEKIIYTNLYGDEEDNLVSFEYKIGDYVREVVDKKIFEKGFTPNWSKEIYLIYARYPTIPPTYQIMSLDGKKYNWKYYKEELQKVNWNYDTFEILDDSNPQHLRARKLNSENQQKEIIIRK